MKPHQITNAANTICRSSGAVCRYEFTLDSFRWNFYFGGRRVKSYRRKEYVLAFAERFINQPGEVKQWKTLKPN